jgi:hypothetical protein
MRSGGDQRPRGRPYGNRPSQPQRGGQQSFNSNGSGNNYGSGDRVRGNPHQLYQRYLTLAQDALRGEDRIAAEGYYQHAEHYFRVANAGRQQQPEASLPIASTAVEPGPAPAEPDEGGVHTDATRFC